MRASDPTYASVFRRAGWQRDVPRAQWGTREGHEFGFLRIFFPNVTGYIGSDLGISAFTQIFPGPSPDKSRLTVLFLRKSPPRESERE